jgi:hypothetical protein
MALYRDYAQTKQAELIRRQQGWQNSTDTTVKGREMTMDFAAAEFTLELLKLDGEIKATLANLKHVELMIAYLRETDA